MPKKTKGDKSWKEEHDHKANIVILCEEHDGRLRIFDNCKFGCVMHECNGKKWIESETGGPSNQIKDKGDKKKKQQTIWHWTSMLSKGNYFEMGVIHNKNNGVKEDIIALRATSTKGPGWQVNMRVDEAITIVAGLSKTLTRMIYLGGKHKELFIKSAWPNE